VLLSRNAPEGGEVARRAACRGGRGCRSGPARPCNFTWARLNKRVYEVDPLRCPECGTTVKVISFIEPPQQDVIEKILKHCGRWKEPVICRNRADHDAAP
jgi:hypothetical protein